MTMNIERFANYQDDTTPQTTHFEQNSDLSVTLVRGAHQGGHEGGLERWDGTVLVRLNVDDEDYALVEVEPSVAHKYASLATIEAALVHLQAVRDRLRAFAAIEAAS